jgi:hypothetical protein
MASASSEDIPNISNLLTITENGLDLDPRAASPTKDCSLDKVPNSLSTGIFFVV